MKILAIETSCDETSASIISDGILLSNIISTQIEFHKKWGGVVPSLAQRLHREKIDIVIKRAFTIAGTNIEDIDYIAVTNGPGLAIALGVGIEKAKELSIKYNKPLIPVNHMMGHIYAAFSSTSNPYTNFNFPYMALLVSGGHTELVYMKNHGEFTKIGETLDDAIGEAYDKVSKMLDLGYPGGPIISKLAKEGNEKKYKLTIPMRLSDNYNFSYSGLKTATSRLINQIKETENFDKSVISNIAATFQYTAVEEILIKLQKALDNYEVVGLILGGGVSANTYLRSKLRKICKSRNISFMYPNSKKLCTDNAGMIATAAYQMVKNNVEYEKDINKIDREPDLSF